MCFVVGENLVSESYEIGIFSIFFNREVLSQKLLGKLVSDKQNYFKCYLFIYKLYIAYIWNVNMVFSGFAMEKRSIW